MQLQSILVTPKMAKELLDLNICNRNLKDRTIDTYVTSMKNGLWVKDTYEPIKISESNVLLDGQHRLMAIVKSNCSVYLQIATGLKDDIFKVIDTGSKRNTGDIFTIENIPNANNLPAMISGYCRFKKNIYGKGFTPLSNSTILDLYYERENFYQETIKKSCSWYKQISRALSPAMIGSFYCLFYDKCPEMADSFMSKLCGGGDFKAINLLRTNLVNDKMNNKKLTLENKNILIIKTWNYYRKNENIKILKFDFEREAKPIAI